MIKYIEYLIYLSFAAVFAYLLETHRLYTLHSDAFLGFAIKIN